MQAKSRSFHQVYKGHADQVALVRQAVRQHVGSLAVADDVVLIASELAANAILHSESAGEHFAVAVDVHPDCVRVEVADLGGPWDPQEDDSRPHGLDIVALLAAKWGVDRRGEGVRVVWARVDFTTELMTRRQVASRFGVTSAAVATWARRGALPEVRDDQGRPRYRRGDVERLHATGFRRVPRASSARKAS
jgi:hypothetical protein